MDGSLKKYLMKLTCRGCINNCSLATPGCGRSKIFIKEAEEKFYNKESIDKFGTQSFIK